MEPPDRSILIPLPWHDGARLLLEEVRHGRERALLVGAKGLGKSQFVRTHSVSNAERERRLVYASLAEVRSGAGALAAVLDAVHASAHPAGRTLYGVSDRARRRGANHLLSLCVDELAARNVGAVVLDEASFLATPALAHVAQLIDHCAFRHQHALGLLLVTTTLEWRGLQESEELGQRLTTVMHVSPLSVADVEAVLGHRSPELARALQKAGLRRREALMQALVRAVDGAVRRLLQIVERAERDAARRRRPVDLDELERAIGLQA